MSSLGTITGSPFASGDTLNSQTITDIANALNNALDMRSGQTNTVASDNAFTGANGHSGTETFSGTVNGPGTFNLSGAKFFPPVTAFSNLSSITPAQDGALILVPSTSGQDVLYVYDANETAITTSLDPFCAKVAGGGVWKMANYALIPKEFYHRKQAVLSSAVTLTGLGNYSGGALVAGNLIPVSTISNFANATLTSNTGGASGIPKAKNKYSIEAELRWRCQPWNSNGTSAIGAEIFGCLIAYNSATNTYDCPLATPDLESLWITQAASQSWTSGMRSMKGTFSLSAHATDNDVISFYLALVTPVNSTLYVQVAANWPITFTTKVKAI